MATFINGNNPILLGKVSKFNENNAALTGHLGDVRCLTTEEYHVLKSMDGFRTFDELSETLNIDKNLIIDIFHKFEGAKTVSSLSDWNQIGWCEDCRVYVAGENCSICTRPVKKLVFSPPCDPFICFDEERAFIVRILHEKFHIDIEQNSLLIANNGVSSNVFFWEIAYNGSIFLKILFPTFYEKDWQYELISEPNISFATTLDDLTIGNMIKANLSRQEQLINTSTAFLYECSQIYQTKPLIYFSGGKESQVMLSLVEKINLSSNVITVVTGVEFPDDISFINSYKQRITGNKLFEYYFYEDDGKRIINTLNERKILSAKDPWCRTDFKRELKNKGTKDIYKGADFVACEGSRWYENDFRRRHTKVNFISDYMHQVWIHPIAEWTSFDVWLYIFKNEIPINPLYYKGFQRTTCWLCPIVNPFHMRSSIKYYPELWDVIKDCKLEAFGDDTTKDLPF